MRRIRVHDLAKMKSNGQRFSMLTAYDFTMASLLDQAGIEVLLVGDSLGMVVQGRENTVPVTVEQMIYHGEMVARAAQHAMVVVDLPFPHGQLGVLKTLEVAAEIVKQTNCQAVKLEGGAEQADTIRAMVAAGIAVIAHVGLRPQSVNALGGYRVQRDEAQIMEDSLAAQEAGAFCVLMESVPQQVAAKVTSALQVPTIGIGAGAACDGQVLVVNDLLGLTVGHVPKFVRKFANLKHDIQQAAKRFNEAVKSGEFPAKDESFS